MSKSKHPLYETWRAMNRRCTDVKATGYDNYGGRGIKVCKEWSYPSGLLKFAEDMGEKPLGTSLDRVDNNGNYELSNCRWSTYSEQSHNRRFLRKNKTGFLGVMKHKRGGFYSILRSKRKVYYLGYYDNPYDAYEAYAIRRECIT